MLNLAGWTYLFMYGYSASVWGRGNERVMMDETTGKLIIRYTV
jgi:hypothetical protein